MPIKFKSDLEWGQSFYIKNDPEQLEHLLVGVVIIPQNQLKFRLSYLGQECEVFDFEVSAEPDKLKELENIGKDDDE